MEGDLKKYRDSIIMASKKRQNEGSIKKQYLNSIEKFRTNDEIDEKAFKIVSTELTYDAINYIMKRNTDGFMYLLSVGNRAYTLNKRFAKSILQKLKSGELFVEEEMDESDKQAVQRLRRAKSFKLTKIYGDGTHQVINGKFFPFIHKLDFDFSELQIYKEFNSEERKNDEGCLIHALKLYYKDNGLNESDVDKIKLFLKTRAIPQRILEDIAKELGITITVRRLESNKNLRKYNVGQEHVVQLGLEQEHYFLIKKINITRYAIQNYDEIKEKEEWWKIYNSRGDKCEGRYTDSYKAIMDLLDSEYLISLKPDELMETIYYDPDFSNIDADENVKCRMIEYTEKPDDDYINIFFDFEANVYSEFHTPYLVCSIDDDDVKCNKVGKTGGKRLLEKLARRYEYKDIKLIAHNCSYDFQFLFHLLHRPTIIKRGSKLLCACGFIYVDKKQVKLKFVDSYSFLSMKLCDFSDTFKIDVKKEVMPYPLWNTENIMNELVPIEICEDACRKQVVNNNIGITPSEKQYQEFRKEFINNCLEWDCVMKDPVNEEIFINIIEYSKRYCEADCKVLQQGYNTFKKWIKDLLNLNIDNFITISSLADEYFKKEGVYDGCYEVGGTALKFIQNAMVGGRTMTRQNKMWYITFKLDDLDAKSLYPSAMKRLGEIGGFLKGKPKLLINKTYGFLQSVDGYFVKIKILKIGKKYPFPLLSRATKENREWTNEMEGEIITIDKIALEDLIEFQKVEFEIIDGYYYDEGRNPTIEKVISYVYNERKKLKENKNPAEIVFKLLMNSAYGKTLLKPYETKDNYVSNKDYVKFLTRNYEEIVNIDNLHNKSYKIDTAVPIINHYNRCHIGVEILSMSKRIMNEVMCLAEDIGVPILYQDTDSTHTPVEDIPKLAGAYQLKYGRELIGKNMGQFACDFESKKLKGNIYSVESYFLGKKTYVDKIRGDEDGVYDYHIRAKGINGDAIKHTQQKLGVDVMEVYSRLYNKEKIKFDLACGGHKACFEMCEDLRMISKSIFEREIQFTGEYGDVNSLNKNIIIDSDSDDEYYIDDKGNRRNKKTGMRMRTYDEIDGRVGAFFYK